MCAQKNNDPPTEDLFKKYIGTFGKLQKLFSAYLCLIIGPLLSFNLQTQFLLFLTPPHRCRIEHNNATLTFELTNASSSVLIEKFIPKDGNQKWSQCLMYDRTSDQSYNATRACTTGWEYDLSTWYSTPVSENNWVCDDGWRVFQLHTVFNAGGAIGTATIGLLSDVIGRVKTSFITFTLTGLAGIGTFLLAGNYHLLAICRALAGFNIWQGMMIQVLAMEYMGLQGRFWASTGLSAAISLTNAVLPWFAYWIHDWRKFVLCTAIPMFIVPLLACITPESFRWQVSKGEIEKAVQTLRQVAKINGRTLPESIVNRLTTRSDATPPLTHVFRFKRLCFIYFLTCVVWMLVATTYIGSAIYAATLTDNPFMMLSVFGGLDFASAFASQWIANAFGRKTGTVVAGLLGFGSYLALPFIPTEQGAFRTQFVLIGRFAAGIAWSVQLPYGAEVLPTVIRSSAVTVRLAFGCGASIFAPTIVSSSMLGSNTSLIIFGIFMGLVALVGVLLPETRGQPMPETLEDGNVLGLKHKPKKDEHGETNLGFVHDKPTASEDTQI